MFTKDILRESELRLLSGLMTGEPVDYRTGGPEGDDPMSGEKWTESREVRADVLCEMLQFGSKLSNTLGRRISAIGLRITGRLDLEGKTLQCPLVLVDCFFDDSVNLRGAKTQTVELSGSRLPELYLDNGEVNGDLVLREGFHCVAGVSLRSCHVRGQVDASGAVLAAPFGVSVVADKLTVDGSVFLSEDLTAHGELRLLGARIKGSLSLARAKLVATGLAITADDISVEGDLLLNEGFTSTGEVRLAGGRIGGTVDISGGRISNAGQTAILGDRLQVGGDFNCDRFVVEGEVRLPDARIRGTLSLVDGQFLNPGGRAVTADGITVDADVLLQGGRLRAEGEVRLNGAKVGRTLNCTGVSLENRKGRALSADWLTVDGDFLCGPGFVATGEVWLLGAQIGNRLDFNGAEFRRENGVALVANGLHVDTDMSLGEGFLAEGEVSLRGASVGGVLDCTKGRFNNPNRRAIFADRLQVEGDALFSDGFVALGEVRLPNARIANILNCRHAQFLNLHRTALNARGIQVGGNLECTDEFVAEGLVDLTGAGIGGNLDLTNARLTNGGTAALTLHRAKISGATIVRTDTFLGELDLTYADVGSYEDNQKTREVRTRLEGFVYDAISPTEGGPKRRLDWLDRQQGTGYAPQPYEQLTLAYRSSGDEEAAREAAVRRRRRRRQNQGAAGRLWSFFLDLGVGYGYKTWRAFALLLVLLLAGSLVFAVAHPDNFTPLKPAGQMPSFNPVVYTLDVLIPVINLNQRTSWSPEGYALLVALTFTVLGWLLATLVVAAVTGLNRKD